MKKGKLTQKISSLFVIMAMLVTMLAGFGTLSVSAAFDKTTIYNWHVHNANSPDGAVTRDTTIKHGGEASLNILLNSGTFYLSNPITTLSMEQNTKYRIEYYAKTTQLGSTHNVVWDSNDGAKQAGLFSASVTSEEEVIDGTATGWTKYHRDFTTGSNPVIYFIFTGAMNISIDDIKIYKYTGDVLGTENLVEDGDFEATAAISHGSNEAIEGYTVSYTYAGKYVPGKLYASTNTDKANVRTGNGSLKLVRSGYANKYPSPTIRLTSNVAPTAGNSYKLTYYVKDDGDTSYANGSVSATNTNAGIAWTLGGVTNNASNSTVFTRTEEADAAYPGWDKLEAIFSNVTSTATLQLTVMAHFDGYMDDISLYQLDSNGAVTGSNLLEHGSFDVVVPDPMEYEPKNPLMISAYSTGGSINTSWRNPEKDNISKVSLIDITDAANPVVLSDTLSTTAGDSVEYFTSGLTASKTYTYKLKFDFADGETREVIMSQKPFAYDGNNNTPTGKYPALLYASGTESAAWRLMYPLAEGGSNAYVLPANVTVDTEETYGDSKGSLHIQTNKDAEATRPNSSLNWKTAYYIRLDNIKEASSSFINSATYRIKWMMKNKNMNMLDESGARVYLAGADGYMGSAARAGFDACEDWTQWSIDRTCNQGTAGGLRLFFPTYDVEDMWLDNIEVWELDDQGNEVKNILANSGGFDLWTAAAAVTEASADADNRSVTINYTPPTDSRYVRVYEKGVFEGEEQWKLRAVCEPTETSVTLGGLTNGTQYTYKLVSQSCLGVYSDAVMVSATPVSPDYEIESDFAFKLNSADADAITGNGTYSVSLDITNYTVSNFAPALIVALYKDDILVGFDKSDNIIAADEITKTLTANVSIADYDTNAKYEVCAFFWDGFDSMNPLTRGTSWNN